MSDFDPSHLQDISALLLKSEDCLDCILDCDHYYQCLYRSIINRSYYAAFSSFKIWAIDNKEYDENLAMAHYRRESISRGWNPPGRHKVLTLFILDNADPNYEDHIRLLADDLDTIRENRNNADYVFDIELSKVDAETVFNTSQNIIAGLL